MINKFVAFIACSTILLRAEAIQKTTIDAAHLIAPDLSIIARPQELMWLFRLLRKATGYQNPVERMPAHLFTLEDIWLNRNPDLNVVVVL